MKKIEELIKEGNTIRVLSTKIIDFRHIECKKESEFKCPICECLKRQNSKKT